MALFSKHPNWPRQAPRGAGNSAPDVPPLGPWPGGNVPGASGQIQSSLAETGEMSDTDGPLQVSAVPRGGGALPLTSPFRTTIL